MDYENIDTIREQIAELNRQAAELQSKAAKLQHTADRKNEQRTPFHNVQLEHIPIVLQLPAYPEFAKGCNCNCRCRSLVSVSSNGTFARGVYLGLVRAGDVADLSQHALRQLDDGLKAITQYLVPRNAGAPTSGSFTRCKNDMIALLNKVSLRADPVPGESADHLAAFRDIDRGRYLRLADARQGLFGRFPDGHAVLALHFETFLQLVHFRGIDLEALG